MRDNISRLSEKFVTKTMLKITIRYRGRYGVNEYPVNPFEYANVKLSLDFRQMTVEKRIYADGLRPLIFIFMLCSVSTSIEDMPRDRLRVWWGHKVMKEFKIDAKKYSLWTWGWGTLF